MKDYLQLLAVFAVMLILIPCVGYAGSRVQKEDSAALQVRILFEESGKVENFSMREYIIGAVFAQMPADFEPEALRAGAVLASTYARRRIAAESASPDESLHGAHMSDDGERFQAFFTESQAKEVYGSGYEAAYEKISAAADFAKNSALYYDGEPIMVAFHGISYGSTESALTMWGEEIPYLTAVDSEWDAELSGCRSEFSFSQQQMLSLIEENFPECEAGSDPGEWIAPAEVSEGGTVLSVSICGEVFDSGRLCTALGLPSQHFTVSLADGSFTVECLGYGHLVGMSQYGANEMAKRQKSCEEILLHYFPGTQLVRFES